MPLVAYHPHNASLAMDNIDPGEMQLGVRLQEMPYHYSRGPQDMVSKLPNDKESCPTESNLNSEPERYKLSMPANGDWSDRQGRRDSGTAVDVTNPEKTNHSPKDRNGVSWDGRNEKRKMKRFRSVSPQSVVLCSTFMLTDRNPG